MRKKNILIPRNRSGIPISRNAIYERLGDVSYHIEAKDSSGGLILSFRR